MSSPGIVPCWVLLAPHQARRPKPSSSWKEEDVEEPPLLGRGRSRLSQCMPSSLFTTKKGMTRGEGSWHTPSTGCPALVMMGCRQEAGLACRVTLAATEGLRASSGPTLAENPQRIQFLDEVIGMLIVLGKEAEGHGCHRVVTPGPVQAAEEVSAFLGKERTIGVWSPLGARTWHGEPRYPTPTRQASKWHQNTKGHFWTHQVHLHWHEPQPQRSGGLWGDNIMRWP